ncbi:hypothetical protein GJ496_007274 [Pomphorhynchus laevis]|nr:hypothetical protein GJ496_007274 [Pomphorhynchus laevis]
MISQALSARYGYYISGKNVEPNQIDDRIYLDIDDILSSQELVPCRLNSNISLISFESSNEMFVPVEGNTEYHIPIWLAQVAYLQGIATVTLPEQFKQIFRDIMQADPTVPNVNEYGPYYFRTGMYCSFFDNSEAKLVTSVLAKV